ncbi:MAG: DegT/DnrJ/EryC1/StrS family aminotransferase [Actinobacteria bacterium]|nr:MAG: DegT/DnrJ/EryC1/StrS family aminotransferase [Actinomycetota bacterium]
MIPFMDLDRQHESVSASIDAAIDRVRRESAFTLGEEVEEFEHDFASYCGAKRAIGVGSGTDAIHLTLRALGIGAGDEVITAVNTFTATAEAIVMAGATPVFVDVDEDFHLIDVTEIEERITPRTRAILPVHLYGQPADMQGIADIAASGGFSVIEDACQAHGARLEGERVGGLGDAACFSFYPSKNLGAMGDGGIVVTNDGELAERIRRLRNHGENEERLHLEAGYCSRLHALQAAILSAKLPSLEEWNGRRRLAAEWYEEALRGLPVETPVERESAQHVFHLYVVRSARRERLREALSASGVGTGIHYQTPLHLEPAYRHLGYRHGDFPVAEALAEQILSLPMYPYLSEAEIGVVADAVAAA